MTHDARADLKDLVIKTLTFDNQVAADEALRAGNRVVKYIDIKDIGGQHFELLDVTVKFDELCSHILNGRVSFFDDRFAGLILIGTLRWFNAMRRFCRSVADPLSPISDGSEIGIVEATVCLALRQQESDAEHYSPDDTTDALYQRVDDILARAGFEGIDEKTFFESIDRVQWLGCLITRAGAMRLRKEVKFQIPEE